MSSLGVSTSIGIFWIDYLCKPFAKHLLDHPLVVLLVVGLVYAGIAYKVIESTYLSENN